MTMVETVKATQVGPLVVAKEWALRQGMAIAERNVPYASFQTQAVLAKDIAEALQSVFDMQEMVWQATLERETTKCSMETSPASVATHVAVATTDVPTDVPADAVAEDVEV